MTIESGRLAADTPSSAYLETRRVTHECEAVPSGLA